MSWHVWHTSRERSQNSASSIYPSLDLGRSVGPGSFESQQQQLACGWNGPERGPHHSKGTYAGRLQDQTATPKNQNRHVSCTIQPPCLLLTPAASICTEQDEPDEEPAVYAGVTAMCYMSLYVMIFCQWNSVRDGIKSQSKSLWHSGFLTPLLKVLTVHLFHVCHCSESAKGLCLQMVPCWPQPAMMDTSSFGRYT